MPIFAESKKEIFAEILGNVLSSTNITQTSPGSKARALVEAFSDKLGDVWTKFDSNMAHAFLDGAEGKYLDFFGDMFGMSRRSEAPVRISGMDKLIKFYRDPVNKIGSIPIPVGTIISTLPSQTGIKYVTTGLATLYENQEEVFVAARSLATGAKGNVGKNTLIYHNVSLPVGVTSPLLISNTSDIVSGTGIEGDENFRFRISKHVLSSEAANLTAIRMAALSVPGIADVEILEFYRGVGTFEVLVKSIKPSVSESLLSTVRESLYFATAQGVSFNVRRPKEIGVSMELSIVLRDNIIDNEKLRLIQTAQDTLFDYIDNLDIGEELIIAEIIQRVMAIDDNIKKMGTAASPIDRLFVHEATALSGAKIRKQVIQLGGTPVDYAPAGDEKLLIHADEDTPIRVKVIYNG